MFLNLLRFAEFAWSKLHTPSILLSAQQTVRVKMDTQATQATTLRQEWRSDPPRCVTHCVLRCRPVCIVFPFAVLCPAAVLLAARTSFLSSHDNCAALLPHVYIYVYRIIVLGARCGSNTVCTKSGEERTYMSYKVLCKLRAIRALVRPCNFSISSHTTPPSSAVLRVGYWCNVLCCHYQARFYRRHLLLRFCEGRPR